MTSQLNVDTIVDKAGSGGTNVKIGNTSVTVSEGGSATTNTAQGLTKQWSKYDQLNSSTVDDSFNTTSITDTATGKYVSNFTNNMNNANYSASGSCIGIGYYYGITTGPHSSEALTTSAYGMRTIRVDTEALADMTEDSTTLNGDLA